MTMFLVFAGLVALMCASFWMIFAKAGEAGWKSLIPIYGAVVMLRIVGRPWWWMFLFLIPFVNLIPSVMVCLDLARVFGKGTGFAVGLMLLSPIFVMMLAFGSAQYRAPAKKVVTPPTPAQSYPRRAA